MIKEFKYIFPYWGPFLMKFKITKEDCNWILKEGKKFKNKSYTFHQRLPHMLEAGYTLDNQKGFIKQFGSYFDGYIEKYNTIWNVNQRIKKWELDSLWVNFMQKGDFAAPHTHSNYLSFVFYPKVSKKIKEENKKYEGVSSGPGTIEFFNSVKNTNDLDISTYHFLPEDGDAVIFPATLLHCVYPFYSNSERISLSGNLKIKL